MTIVTVQELGQSQKGKPKVKAGGQWYFLASDKDTGAAISSPTVGQSIEIRAGEFYMGETKFLTIEAWRPAGQAAPAKQADVRQPPPKTDAAHYIEEASLRFISNVVGQAIAAKTITTPGQILGWFTAAKLALEGKKAAAPFDDDLPSREPGADDDRGNW